MPGSPAVLDTALVPRAGQALPSGVLAFLITDIEGSTQRWEAWPEAMRVAMARHDHLVREALLRASGHVFRTAGDAFYAAFVSPSDAIAAALAAQQALGGEDFSGVGGIKVRMAIHAGPAESRDNDYFGQGMNRCARLLGIAYGGQVLISAAAADMARGELPPQASLLDLGQHRLKDLAGAEQVYQLVAPGLTARFPTLRSLDAKVNNLPRPVTSFVPREADVAEVKARLAKYRIVTLVGSGGAGKTRLAVEVGADAPGGVSRRRLDRRACAARGSRGSSPRRSAARSGCPCRAAARRSTARSDICARRRRSSSSTIASTSSKPRRTLAEELVLGCPSLLLLATSREPLGIDGESTYRVPSLSFPSRTEGITAAEAARLRRGPPVRRARHRRPSTASRLTDANAPAVANICKHLDGIPMAIELAVPQLRMMPAQGLATPPARPLPPARQGKPHGPPAPPDAADAVRLELQPPHRRREDAAAAAFRVRGRLDARFGRASSPPAAPVEDGNVFDLLSCLADKSLVVPDFSGGEPRYKFLETARQYAFHKLQESGERGRRRRLAEYLIRFYAEAGDGLADVRRPGRGLRSTSPSSTTCAPRSTGPSGPRATRGSGSSSSATACASGTSFRCLPERERWFATALERMREDAPPATKARLWLGRTSSSAHGDRTNFEPARSAAELFRAVGDRHGLGEALAKAGAALETPTTTGRSAAAPARRRSRSCGRWGTASSSRAACAPWRSPATSCRISRLRGL